MSLQVASARLSTVSWDSAWLYGRRWDLTYIIFSSVLVAVPFLLYYQFRLPMDAIDILIAMAIGGPHMYATYSLTFMEPSFIRQHPIYISSALLIPIGVVTLALWNLTILMTIFLLWASVHVLHQIVFITECYRAKGRASRSLSSRIIDYAVVFSSLYPFAIYKLVNDQFVVSNRLLQIPAFLRTDWLIVLVWAVFLISLATWAAKSTLEFWQGRLNLPKTILMTITIGVAFVLPLFDNLSVAFQGFNVWHSFQYLALTWYLNKLRKDRNEIGNPVVRKISGAGSGARFYLFHVGITLAAGLAVVFLRFVVGLEPEQAYYIVILSCLLVHYYIDHFLFTRIRSLVPA